MTAQPIVSEVETNPSDFEDWLGLHGLLSDSFAYMDGRIDPPSSLLRLTPEGLEQKSRTEDLYLIRDGGAPVACAFGTITGECYYLGKLAVAASQRGQGLARGIIEAAAQTARKRGLSRLELQTRVELRENHRTFRRLGFTLVGASAHPGYDHATSLTFRRRV
ncbi:GNAT family N-acetyltransferase [Roseibacterium beibuensis]|uniref:GNAT family N-acetyltransferase n=2 Tax=[Roseibacterium] beibuensis TaxID=1193142 RepID=A0ABP9L5A7_9RHOB|nr:GNAT family N-acetyltransferase [Roseibacterium beibuensis]MCS6621430.1 GNAT family N-acetyltransferase [Roseibacterium beibuensis]